MSKNVTRKTSQTACCRRCDESFSHLGEKELTCPKCGAKGKEWIKMSQPTAADQQQALVETEEVDEKLSTPG